MDPSGEAPRPQKRKEPPTAEGAEPHKQPKVENEQPKVRESRGIWVTNIPLDATLEELHVTFKRFGLIDLSVDKTPRIKMYADDDGKFNGEALIVYFKPDSVALAVQFFDGEPLRIGMADTEGVLNVEVADDAWKKNTDKNTIVSKMARKDRKQADRNRAELNRQLAEWSDNEEEVRQAFAPKKNKWAKNAIIQGVFRPWELEEDEDAYNEIRDLVQEKAEKYGGEVTKIIIYDREPRGIVLVRFKTLESAERFQKSPVNNSKVDGRPVTIELAEDRPKFLKSKREDHVELLSPSEDEGN